MAVMQRYIRMAAASKRAGFALPVIESAQDALLVAKEMTESLARLQSDERLAMLSDLCELSDTLAKRVEHLRQESASLRIKLQQARLSGKVCQTYARKSGVALAPGLGRRSPCP